MTRILMDRLPTAKELDDGYAAQVAADYERTMRAYGRLSKEVDVARPAPAPPEVTAAPAPSPSAPPAKGRHAKVTVFCRTCGRMFKGSSGTAAMQRNKHERKEHPAKPAA